MSFLHRASAFLAERVGPHLVFGRSLDDAALADLERQARAELDARIGLGRPGPDEWQPSVRPGSPRPTLDDVAAPVPDAVPAPMPLLTRTTRPVGVHTVSLGALARHTTPSRTTGEISLTQRPA